MKKLSQHCRNIKIEKCHEADIILNSILPLYHFRVELFSDWLIWECNCLSLFVRLQWEQLSSRCENVLLNMDVQGTPKTHACVVLACTVYAKMKNTHAVICVPLACRTQTNLCSSPAAMQLITKLSCMMVCWKTVLFATKHLHNSHGKIHNEELFVAWMNCLWKVHASLSESCFCTTIKAFFVCPRRQFLQYLFIYFIYLLRWFMLKVCHNTATSTATAVPKT